MKAKPLSYQQLLNRALHLLSYRPRSKVEIIQKLQKYTSNSSGAQLLIQQVIQKLEELNYLNDFEFAQWFIESRLSSRPRSSRYLKFELMNKGISQSIIKSALINFANDEQAIKSLIQQRSYLSKPKLIAYLYRRGFNYSTIKTAIANQSSNE